MTLKLGAPTCAVAICLCWAFSAETSAQSTWAFGYTQQGLNSATSIGATADGGFILAGNSSPAGSGAIDPWLMKLDGQGNIVWTRSYGGSGDDSFSCVRQTNDGGFIVAGRTDSFGSGQSDGWILKTDSAGYPNWQWTYGTPFSDGLRAIEQTSDGGYIAAGSLNVSFAGGEAGLGVLKLDPQGNLVWWASYDEEGLYPWATSIAQVDDGGYIVAGSTSMSCFPCGQALILRLTPVGSILWQKTYGVGAQNIPLRILQTPDGGYVFAGDALVEKGGSLSLGAWLARTDGLGGLMWSETFDGGYTRFSDLVIVPADGSYLLAGITQTLGESVPNSWVVKVDPEGTPQWQRSFGGGSGDSWTGACLANDGGFVIAGSTTMLSGGLEDPLALKIASDGMMNGTCWLLADAWASVSAPLCLVQDTAAVITGLLVAKSDSHAQVVSLNPVTVQLCPCELSCGASVSPLVGPVGLAFQGNAITGLPADCVDNSVFIWDFGDGTTSSVQNPVHVYSTAGTFAWTVVISLNGTTCTRSGVVTALPFDKTFFDDLGRSRLCANSATGAWKWDVLTGAGMGSYSGVGRVSVANGVMYFSSKPGEPWQMSLKHYLGSKRAVGSFVLSSKRVNSSLVDSNTTNTPPGC